MILGFADEVFAFITADYYDNVFTNAFQCLAEIIRYVMLIKIIIFTTMNELV